MYYSNIDSLQAKDRIWSHVKQVLIAVTLKIQSNTTKQITYTLECGDPSWNGYIFKFKTHVQQLNTSELHTNRLYYYFLISISSVINLHTHHSLYQQWNEAVSCIHTQLFNVLDTSQFKMRPAIYFMPPMCPEGLCSSCFIDILFYGCISSASNNLPVYFSQLSWIS